MPLICSRRNCDNVGDPNDRDNYCPKHQQERKERTQDNWEHYYGNNKPKILARLRNKQRLLRMFAREHKVLFEQFKEKVGYKTWK